MLIGRQDYQYLISSFDKLNAVKLTNDSQYRQIVVDTLIPETMPIYQQV